MLLSSGEKKWRNDMEKYTKAELEVIKITSEDIVTESSDIDFCPGDNSDTPIVPIP